jgi:hypothetical protein
MLQFVKKTSLRGRVLTILAHFKNGLLTTFDGLFLVGALLAVYCFSTSSPVLFPYIVTLHHFSGGNPQGVVTM